MRFLIHRTVLLVLVAVCCITVRTSSDAYAVEIDTFHGLTPARLLDTRFGSPTVDGFGINGGPVNGNATTTFSVLGRGGVPSSGVGSVALNVTVTNPTDGGYLSVYPGGVMRSTSSNLNFRVGQTAANMVLVPVGDYGLIDVFNGSGGTVDVIVDVLGWFPTGASFSGLTPARLLDTRTGGPTIDGQFTGTGAVAAQATSELSVLGRAGIPTTGMASVALNVTVTNPTAAGYLTVYPTGTTQPATSSLNFTAGRTVPNMVIVPVDANGQLSIFNGSNGTADVIVDVLGWFPTGTAFSGVAPARLMDSRIGTPTFDGRFGGGGAIRAATTINLVVAGRGDVPATNVGSVALNVTVTQPSEAGYLTIYPQGAARPLASNLNFATGQTVANMVIVPVGGGGQVSIFSSAGSHVIVDVLGWFANPTSPATTYGNNLVLKSNGIGSAVFGDPVETTIDLAKTVFGTPSHDETIFRDQYGATPYYRSVCFTGLCLQFEGATHSTLKFIGWTSSSERLIDVNGLGKNSRGSDFPGAIAQIGRGDRQCFPSFPGESASGIFLAFNYHGTDNSVFVYPTQSEITVASMSAGSTAFGICM